jgi:hypothetical protein
MMTVACGTFFSIWPREIFVAFSRRIIFICGSPSLCFISFFISSRDIFSLLRCSWRCSGRSIAARATWKIKKVEDQAKRLIEGEGVEVPLLDLGAE